MKLIEFLLATFFLLLFPSAKAQVLFPDRGEIFVSDQIPRIDLEFSPDSLERLLDPSFANSDHHYQVRFIFDNGNIRDTLHNVGLRLRGNTSRNAAKKSFKLSFNTYQSGRKYQGLEKLNLNGEHNDPSIARSRICWDLLEDFKIPASRSNHIDLYINDEYFGVYVNVEHVDEEFVQSRFGNQNGNLYKCLWPADLVYRGPDPDDYKFSSSGRRAYDLKTNTDKDDYSDIAEFIDVLNNTPIADLPCELDKVFNVDNMIRAIAFDILSGNWDGPLFNKNNFYLYHNPSTDKFEYIPYDLDNTFGIDWFGQNWATRDIYKWGGQGEPRPLFYKLLAPQEHKDLLSFYIDQFIKEFYNQNNLIANLEEIKNQIASSAENDPFRPLDYGFSFQDFLDSYSKNIGYNHVSSGVKPFINTRKSSALSQLDLNDIKPIIRNVNLTRNNNELTIFAEAKDDEEITSLSICYEQGSNDQECLDLLDNGVYPDQVAGDGIFSGLLTIATLDEPLMYFIEARDNKGNSSSYPYCDQLIYSFGDSDNKLIINEILTSNSSINSDENGEYDDWIELYNSGSIDIFLGNKFLSDDRFEADKWKLPNVSIGPGEFLLVWADDDEEQGEWHSNFRLDKDGEFIGLFEQQGEEYIMLQGFDFGSQEKDISFGSYPDASPQQDFLMPTPGFSNELLVVENLLEKPFYIFPNPMKGQCKIEFEKDLSNLMSISLYNMTGKKISSDFHTNSKSTVILDGLKPSAYFLKIEMSNEIYIEKIIVL